MSGPVGSRLRGVPPRSALRGAAWVALVLLPVAACAEAEPRPRRAPADDIAAPERAAMVAIPPLPTNRHGHRMHFLGDDLIVFGGFSHADAGRGKEETWILSLESGEWRRGPDLGLGKAFFASVVVDRDVYAVGGSVERYDERERRWETIAPDGTVPTSHFGAAAVGRRIYTLGGFPTELAPVSAFDVDTRERVDVPPLPGFSAGDHFHFVARLGGELHVVGGIRNEGFRPDAQHWVLRDARWVAAAPPPAPTWTKFAAWGVVDGDLLIFDEDGGHRYDPDSDVWTGVTPLDELVAMPGCDARDGRLYVLGGTPPGDPPAVRVYDTARDTWTRTR